MVSFPNIQEILTPFLKDIDPERKIQLEQLARYILVLSPQIKPVPILAVCTHNSRRSQAFQFWLDYFSTIFDRVQIKAYSGGTEATAFYPTMIQAISQLGFMPEMKTKTENPSYHIQGIENSYFSKKYNHQENPSKEFIAIMVCDHASENCPIIHGARFRLNINYVDPKHADGTDHALEEYLKCLKTIGAELWYTFQFLENIR